MASLNKTIAGRITLGVLAIHVLILPTLYFGMVYLLNQSNEELFLNSVRGHARFLADSLERAGGTAAEEEEIIEVLDSLVLSGSGVFAELVGDSRRVVSSLVGEDDAAKYQEDLALQKHGDETYYFSVPVLFDGGSTNLRVGFDESPYLEQKASAYRSGLIVIAGYVAVLLMLLPIIGRRVVRPVKALQRISRDIASGALSEELTVESDLIEFVELSQDLEMMKSRLIGISEQLHQKMRDHEQAEIQRLSLEQQLRHSQRLETVGTMAGGIAHELNNILLPIILYTDTAMEDLPPGSPIRQDLRRVLGAATRAKGIVGQILTFSRKMEGGDYDSVDMAAVVQDSVELMRALLPAFTELELDIESNCPPVLGDASLMSQLVLNLCTNAFQALNNSQGRVSISLRSVEVDKEFGDIHPGLGHGECVQLTVTDTGEGIDEQSLERIFEPFFTTRGVGKGTGLGLSVVHGIVTDANGAIEVESAVESGSSFHVFLPAFQKQATSHNEQDPRLN